jgi:hypothetical protein
MKKAIISLGLALIVLAVAAAAQTPTYVGADKCALCHKTEKQGQQYVIWQGAKHAKSFAALSSPQAAAHAKAMDVANPVEDPKCLKCHAPLHDKAPALKAEGVTCEVCHGPGSDYKALAAMKNREESAKKGLILFPTPDDVKAQCLKCHESAHGITFDFAAAWAKIKHPIPAK